jgi:hypothetical protein
MTDDGRNVLQRLKDDKELLEDLLELFKVKDRYKSRTYSPINTKEDKPLTHKLNPSYFGFFQQEVESYSQLQTDQRAWKTEASSKLGGINLDNYEKDILEGKSPGLQRLLFSNLGEELPIIKTVNDIQSLDYNLAFYIPFFKWLMPETFPNSIKDMSEPDLRKLHIRKIKDFITGKI